jgi:ribosome-binding protein aMBF1 (putative translation factor)
LKGGQVPLDSYFQGQLYDWLMPIGDRIRQARIKAGMRNQQMLADAIGVSVQSISQWETGTTTPTRANESKLAEVLEFRRFGFPPGVTIPIRSAPTWSSGR